MNSNITNAAVVSIVFLVVKFIEMRFIEKESRPLKYLFKDALLVFFSAVVGFFLLEKVRPVVESAVAGSSNPSVFTDNPEF